MVCDVASECCVSSFLRWISSSTFLSVGESGRVGGVIHGAGVLRDAWAINQTVRDATSVFGPKAQGAWHLHRWSMCDVVDMVVFSSETVVVGTVGQSIYGAANAYLDSLMYWRRSKGLLGKGIQWGALSDVVGMRARHGNGSVSVSVLQIREVLRVWLGGRRDGIVISLIAASKLTDYGPGVK